MDEHEYYKTLNIKAGSSFEEIKKAFFKIALLTHPDRGGNEAEFKKANNAYQYFREKFNSEGQHNDHHDSRVPNDHKAYESHKKDATNLKREKHFRIAIDALGKLLGRINWFLNIANIAGIAGLVLGAILFLAALGQEAHEIAYGVILVAYSGVIFYLRFYLKRLNSSLTEHMGNFKHVKSNLNKVSILTLVLAVMISPVFLIASLAGVYAIGYFFGIVYHAFRSSYHMRKYMRDAY